VFVQFISGKLSDVVLSEIFETKLVFGMGAKCIGETRPRSARNTQLDHWNLSKFLNDLDQLIIIAVVLVQSVDEEASFCASIDIFEAA
jgi:hypothetical protein